MCARSSVTRMSPNEKLREWMRTAKIRQSVLARLCGVTPSAVSRWATGSSRPNAVAAMRIADASGGRIAAASWGTGRRREPRRESAAEKKLIAAIG